MGRRMDRLLPIWLSSLPNIAEYCQSAFEPTTSEFWKLSRVSLPMMADVMRDDMMDLQGGAAKPRSLSVEVCP